MELSILNMAGKETGKKVVLNDAIFAIEPNDHAIYLDVKQYLANNRQGTAKAKQRSENAHSTRKLGRQKGGGGARPGDLKSPVRVGGGTIFGPVPRDYSFKLNKKVKRLARLSALYYKSKEDNVLVVEDFSFDMPKTKNMVKVLSALKLQDKKTLFVVNTDPKNFVTLSARNIANVKVMNAASVNAYEVLNAKKLVFSETAIVELDKMCANS